MGSGESLLPGLSRAAFSLCPHSGGGGGGGKEREQGGRKGREGGSPPYILISIPPPLPWGLGLLTYDLRGTQTFSS